MFHYSCNSLTIVSFKLPRTEGIPKERLLKTVCRHKLCGGSLTYFQEMRGSRIIKISDREERATLNYNLNLLTVLRPSEAQQNWMVWCHLLKLWGLNQHARKLLCCFKGIWHLSYSHFHSFPMDSHQTTRIMSSIQISVESSFFIYSVAHLLGALLQLTFSFYYLGHVSCRLKTVWM